MQEDGEECCKLCYQVTPLEYKCATARHAAETELEWTFRYFTVSWGVPKPLSEDPSADVVARSMGILFFSDVDMDECSYRHMIP